MMIQLNPTVPLETPKGRAHALFLIDYGQEHDLYWVTFLDNGGECWTFSNREVRAQANQTIGRRLDATPSQGAQPSVSLQDTSHWATILPFERPAVMDRPIA